MAEEVVFLLPGQPPMVGKSAFAAAAQAQSTQPALQFDGTSEIQEINILGEWAFHVDELSVAITPAEGAPSITCATPTLSTSRSKTVNGSWRARC
jgi:ketosteroid isomerase-like protein